MLQYIFPEMQSMAYNNNELSGKKLTLLPFWPANPAVGVAEANCLIGCFADETESQLQAIDSRICPSKRPERSQ